MAARAPVGLAAHLDLVVRESRQHLVDAVAEVARQALEIVERPRHVDVAVARVQVRKVGNSVKLIMYSDVTFAFNSANIKHKFYPVSKD